MFSSELACCDRDNVLQEYRLHVLLKCSLLGSLVVILGDNILQEYRLHALLKCSLLGSLVVILGDNVL